MVDRSSPRYLEVSHIAHRLSVSAEYVLRLIRKKKLKAIRLGKMYRVDPADFDAFIEHLQQATDEDEERPPVRPFPQAVSQVKGA